MSWIAVAAGATLGAWLRWGLGVWLNQGHAQLPVGTVLANLGGGYLIGLAVGFFQANPALPIEWRLFIVTGFLGALTTFSTFSAESVLLLQHGNYGWALLHTVLHLAGSILFCIAGIATFKALAG